MIVAGVTLLLGGIIGYTISQLHEWDETENGMHRMSDGNMMDDHDSRMGENNSPTSSGNMMDKASQSDGGMMMDHGSMMVRSEREFIEEMIPHHQEAIDTAKEVLARGGSTAPIKTLAENIIAAQEAEVILMKEWHLDWYQTAYTNSGSYKPMMRDLSSLNGAALDKVFLEDMVMHHMGAIMMAQSVTPYIEHPEIATLTQAISTSQSAEIVQMRQMLAGL